MQREEIVEKVKQAGVVGAGGAGFPTHVKINNQADIVIANAAECEPILCVDKYLISQVTDLILDGIKLVMEAACAREGIIGIKAKHTKLIDLLEKKLAGDSSIKIKELGDFYPAGDEHVLVYEATKRLVPEGGIPIQSGVVVNNVATLYNISQAVRKNMPVTHRLVNVIGEVVNPLAAKFPIGLTVRDAIEFAGGVKVEPYRVIMGGPVTGQVIDNLDEPVRKTTGGIIVLPENHPLIIHKTKSIENFERITRSVCDQCFACTDTCPRYLLGHRLKPHMIVRAVSYGNNEQTDKTLASSFLCCECGLCGLYACPMGLSPYRVNMALKKKLSARGVKNPYFNQYPEPHSLRNYRLVPSKRLVSRLQIGKYLVEIPFIEDEIKPKQVQIPLCQHIGAPSQPVVKEGDWVREGELIAEIPQGKLGAAVHSSISGRVKEITNKLIIVESL